MNKKSKLRDKKKKPLSAKTAVNRFERKAEKITEILNDKIKKESAGVRNTRIKVIGIGGGGGSIVDGLADRLGRVSFYALNTDSQALAKLGKKIKKISFGEELTHGLGTGRNSELGQMAAINDRDKWKKAIIDTNQSDLYIVVASLGGGVGSGATPVIIKALRETGGIVYGIFTLPFQFEGEKKILMAQVAVEKTRSYLNAYTVIPNESIFNIVNRDVPLNQALQAINDNLGQSLSGLLETIYEPGSINIDFADLRAVFEGRGRLAYLNAVTVNEPDRGSKVVKSVLSSLLYSYDIRGARGIIYNVKGRKLTLEEINSISKAINESANKDAKIIFGTSSNHATGDEIKVTILATGCQTKLFSFKDENEAPKKAKESNSLKKKRRLKSKIAKKKEPEIKKNKQNKNNAKKKKMANPNKSDRETKKQENRSVKSTDSKEEIIKEPTVSFPDNDQKILPVNIKVRRNANQVKQATEEIEEEMLREEKKWEMPAFMRKTLNDNNPQTS